MYLRQRLLNLFKAIPYLLRALWLFFPGILFLLLAVFIFWHLSQGKDIIRQCLEQPRWAGAIAIVAVIFWIFVTWYTARLVAYNHNEFFNQCLVTPGLKDLCIGSILLFHLPRFIAFYIFAVLLIAFLQFDLVDPLPNSLVWTILIVEFVFYLLLHRAFAKYEAKNGGADAAHLIPWRRAVRGLLIAGCVTLILFWGSEPDVMKPVLVIITTLLQFGFLFLVIVRRPVAEWQLQQHPNALNKRSNALDFIFGAEALQKNPGLRMYKEVERPVLRFFNLIALACSFFYLAAILVLPFARAIGPLAFLFLAFGILLGIGNFAALVSWRIRTNLFFIGIVVVFLVGLVVEPHWVRLRPQVAANVALRRPPFREYLQRWLLDASRRPQLQTSAATYPVFFVLADGGASRSGYWTASVLGRLTDETKAGRSPFYQHLFCLSGASGGSVGNGTYLASLAHKDSLLKTDTGFRKTVIGFLGSDFFTFTLGRMLGPDLAAPIGDKIFGGDRAWALEKSFEDPEGGEALAQNMQAPFAQFVPTKDATPFLYPLVVFNTTRMQDGNPGVVSNFDLDSVAFGSRIDVLDTVQAEQLRLSTAMILSARFPYISPGGRIHDNYFVDGGYFDNSGAGMVHEMLLEVNRIKQTHALPQVDTLLNKLRFYVIHITNSPYRSGNIERVHPFRNDLAAPLLTLAGSYESQTNVNNTRLQNYLKELAPDSYIEFNLYKRNKKESFPMDWVISKRSRDSMDTRVYQIPELDSLINRLNRGAPNLFKDLDVRSAPESP